MRETMLASRDVTADGPLVRLLVIVISMAFLGVVLFAPVVLVFAEAIRCLLEAPAQPVEPSCLAQTASPISMSPSRPVTDISMTFPTSPLRRTGAKHSL